MTDFVEKWLDASRQLAQLEAAIDAHRIMTRTPDEADTFLWDYTQRILDGEQP